MYIIWLFVVLCLNVKIVEYYMLQTSSNHRLESAGLNALEELLFEILGMGVEGSDVCLVCKGNWIFGDHFIESVTENWRYFRFSPWTLLQLVFSS